MSADQQIIAVVGGYLALSLFVGIRAGKGVSDSATGFVAGDRAMGGVLMYFVTGATIFSAFAFLGAPGWAWSRGAAAFHILAFGVLGFIPFYFIGPAAARLGRRHGFVTQAELVAARLHSRPLAVVMALVSLLAFIPYLALQMRGSGHVLEVLTRGAIPMQWGAALVYGVVLIYVWRSGVMGVGWTNTLQGLFMMVLAWTLGLYLPYALHGGVGPMFAKIAERDPGFLTLPGRTADGGDWSWSSYASSVFVMAVGFSFWPHLFQKAFVARSERVLRRTVVLYPTFLFFLLPILFIGFAGVGFDPPPDQADQILPHLLLHMDLPALVVGLFCAGALAASMSSGDAILHSAASIVVRDGWIVGLGRPLSPQAERHWVRLMLLPLLLVSYLVAVVFPVDIVGLLSYAYGPVGQLAPPVLGALFWSRATGRGALWGLVVGSVVTIWFSRFPVLPVHAGLLGLVANVLILVGVSLLVPARNSGATAEE
jgi:SSS family solute:Na+ symporter